MTQAQSNLLALRAFFYGYCLTSANQNLSRDFLPGLEMAIYRLGPGSDLAKACQAVEFASGGRYLHRPQLILKAESFHQELVGSLGRLLGRNDVKRGPESTLVSMLLGLGQMVTASEVHHGNHDIHARGLAALMKIAPGSSSLPGQTSIPDTIHHFIKTSGVFSVPALDGQDGNLMGLLLDLHGLWTRSGARYESEDACSLLEDCAALDKRFKKWQKTRATEVKPTALGHLTPRGSASAVPAGCWPGRVDTYFDLYLAGAWNVFRTARLLLITLMIGLSDASGGDSWASYHVLLGQIVDDIVASIPYHLAESLPSFMSEYSAGEDAISPGRALGGWLLMHPLYLASSLPSLPEDIRGYMKGCLTWMGSNMGIGQAALLGKTPIIDSSYLATGWIVIWSGFSGKIC
ncbi:hypothetical protein GQ53DRAFT_787037 [Thozetella sp. PMI_491]|nr:hypothetical protein GQ53DRAFT_787037 [Thozetella sp. PMI_491]